MSADGSLIPVTIWVSEGSLATIAGIAKRRGRKAPELMAQLVERAAERSTRPRGQVWALTRSLPSMRTRESLTDTDAVNMLSMLFLGASAEEIAAKFTMAVDDVELHLTYLQSTNRRSRRRANPAGAAARELAAQ